MSAESKSPGATNAIKGFQDALRELAREVTALKTDDETAAKALAEKIITTTSQHITRLETLVDKATSDRLNEIQDSLLEFEHKANNLPFNDGPGLEAGTMRGFLEAFWEVTL